MSEARSRKLLKIFLPILVLLVGAGATAALIASRKAPVAQERPVLGPLVDVMDVSVGSQRVEVEGQGEVGASVRVDVLPEVAGRVVSVHPRLVAGGHIRAGATLAQIDDRDYRLAVESARASIASAETRLELERAEAEAAFAEWREIHGEAEPPALLVRAPQIRQLEAERAAAEAQLAKAELDLERTRLRVPFDAVVLSKNVDPGQFLNQGRTVATLYGTGAVEIRVPLQSSQLRWFDLPTAEHKPEATVSAELAGARHEWRGTVDRLEGQIDPQTRMAHVVVRVENPFASDPPLLPGTFADVSIAGREIAEIFRIPRSALRLGDIVWEVEGDQLRLRELEVLHTDRTHALVRGELGDRARIVTSSLEGVTDGMTVRVSDAAPDTFEEQG